ncbi:hypothetical protein [Terriglobus roseus]|nr:hypothetical protein [Terriglobus roseus]
MRTKARAIAKAADTAPPHPLEIQAHPNGGRKARDFLAQGEALGYSESRFRGL